MIQLYARLSDLTDCEPTCAFEPEYLAARKSIKEVGIRKALKVHPDGRIAYGNTRWFIARELGLKYVPIDLVFLLGLQYHPDTKSIQLRKEVLPFFMHDLSLSLATMSAPYPPPYVNQEWKIEGCHDHVLGILYHHAYLKNPQLSLQDGAELVIEDFEGLT